MTWTETFNRLAEVCALDYDWDGCGSYGPPKKVAEAARKFLLHQRGTGCYPPNVCPTDGGIIFAWHMKDGSYLDAEIDDPAVIEWFEKYPDGHHHSWEEQIGAHP